MFGIKTSPYHFAEIIEAVVDALVDMGGGLEAFVDDFIVGGARGRRHCEAWVIATRAAFAYLGMSEKVSKAVSPNTQRLEWLGILLDAVSGRLHIPENKKVKLRAAMAAFEAEWRGAAAAPLSGRKNSERTFLVPLIWRSR